jgi:hypothetical protein
MIIESTPDSRFGAILRNAKLTFGPVIENVIK